VEFVIKIQFASVTDGYQNQRVMTRILKQFLDDCRLSTTGPEAIIVECTSYFTYKICEKLGMNLAFELDFSENFVYYNRIVDNDIHKKAYVMVKKFKKN